MTKLWLSYRTTNLWRLMIIIIFFENMVIEDFLACLFNVHYLIFLSMVHEYAYFYEYIWTTFTLFRLSFQLTKTSSVDWKNRPENKHNIFRELRINSSNSNLLRINFQFHAINKSIYFCFSNNQRCSTWYLYLYSSTNPEYLYSYLPP